ncbi:MAG: hypothetical protein Fur0021_35800 [Candidatus Promineifilaceae bacterium]
MLLRVTILETGAANEVATPGVVARSTADPLVQGAALNRITIGFAPGTRYVAAVGAGDGTNCRDPNFPCATIQRAIDQAVAGDDILVAAGVYTDVVTTTIGSDAVPHNIFIHKPVAIRGGYDAANFMVPAQPITNAVILSGENERRVVYVAAGLTDTVTLSSLFIRDGNAPVDSENPSGSEFGGGIYNAGSNLAITGTWVLSNAAQFGGGLYQVTGTLYVNSSVFAGNRNVPNYDNAPGAGGGVYVASGAVRLENATFNDNRADLVESLAAPQGSGPGGAVYQAQGHLSFVNSIFKDNIGISLYIEPGVTVNNDYNLYYITSGSIEPTNFPTGTHSITADPFFEDKFYHIAAVSPAKDAGTSDGVLIDVDFDLEPRLQGSQVDMGADERLLRAAFTFTPVAQAVTLNAGDSHIYTHTLRNTGDFSDTYTLSAVHESIPPGGGFNHEVQPADPILLAPGESALVSFAISGGLPGYVDETTLTAVSTANGASRAVVDTTTISHTAGVAIGEPQTSVGVPGSAVHYHHTLTNTGDGVDAFTLTLLDSAPPDWQVTIWPTATGFVLPGATVPFTVTVMVPADALSGTQHTAAVLAEAHTPYASAILTDTTRAAASFGLSLTPDNERTVTAPGPVTYAHTLTNLGNSADVVTLTYASNPPWDVAISPDAVALPPFGSHTILVNVTVPPGSDGLVHTAVITAASAMPGVYAVAVNTTTVGVIPQPGVTLTPSYAITVTPGSQAAFYHVVGNSGNLTDTIALTAVSAQGWLVGAAPAPVTLPPGASSGFTLTLDVPLNAPVGALDAITVTATSGLDSNVRASVINEAVVVAPSAIAVALTPHFQSRSGAAGEAVAYEFMVTNLGTGADVVTVNGGPTNVGWTVTGVPASFNLDAGSSQTFTIYVEVPGNAGIGSVSLATLIARSSNDPEVFDTAVAETIITGAPVNTLYLPITFHDEGSAPPPTPTPGPSPTPTNTPAPPTPTASPTPCVPTGIDLVVTNITLEPAQPLVGQPVRVSVTMRNQGSTDVPKGNNFYLDFYLDRVPAPLLVGDIAWGVQGADLTAGTSVTFVKENFTFGTAGPHQLWAQADTDNSVNECPHEGNNILGPINIIISASGQPEFTPAPQKPAGILPRHTPTPPPSAPSLSTPSPGK